VDEKPTVIECPKAADRDLTPLYLAGKLSRAEAEAFEEHYFACESCRMDVGKGSEFRAYFGKPAIVPVGRPPRSRRPWLRLAAAAAIALVAAGVWHWTRSATEMQSVSRGAEARIDRIAITPRADGGFDVSWPARLAAAAYAVEVFGPDGRRFWKTETREPHVRIEASVLPPQPTGRIFEVRVEAIDPAGQVTASGEASIGTDP